MFGSLLKGAVSLVKSGGSALASVGRAANKIPGVGAIPVVGNVLAAAGGLATASSLLGGGGGGGLPALPAVSGGLPTLLPGAGAPAIVGDRGVFQNDPNIAKALEPFAISKTNLRIAYRSPIKGFVVVRDSVGDPYALPRALARKYAGWKPSKKPPISVGDWEAVKRADRTIKKVRKITSTMTKVDNATRGGKVVIRRKKKGA